MVLLSHLPHTPPDIETVFPCALWVILLSSPLAPGGEFVVFSWRKTWSRSLLIAPIQCGLETLPTDHQPVLCGLARTKVRLYCELSSFFYLRHMSQMCMETIAQTVFFIFARPILSSVSTKAGGKHTVNGSSPTER
jgi:hypothetical protein